MTRKYYSTHKEDKQHMYIEYKPGSKHPLKDADISDSIDTFQDGGYILTETDIIVDLDNIPPEIIQAMIKTFDIQTQIVYTTRGVHLYFRKPKGFKGAKSVTALGFEVEFKHIKNTKSITLKRDGVLRRIENKGTIQELPEVLNWNRKYKSLLGLDDGDGRNQALYEHRMKMGQLKDWKKAVLFINDHVFADPLPDNEMELLTRDIQIDTDAEDAESQIAGLILQQYNVVLYLDRLYFQQEGEFVSDTDDLRRLVYEYTPGKKTRFVDEVIKQMEYRCKKIDPNANFDIRLNNGILRDGKFIKIDYIDFTPYSIDINYNPEAEPVATVDNYIDQLTGYDAPYRELLLEMMAHTLVVDKEFKRLLAKFFIMIGDGNNGKGTFLQVLRNILGSDNCTALSIANMKDERYFTTMQGKLANLGDDIQDMPIDDDSMKQLKNISTCDYVSTRELFKQSREVELTVSLIFTSNHILKSFEKGESYKRRVLWLPMYSKPKKKDPKFITNLSTKEAREYWLKLMIDGYIRLYQSKTFTESRSVNQFNIDYHEENNGTLTFINDHTAEDFLGKRSPEVYEEYTAWAEENGLNVQSRKILNTTIEDEMGIKIKSTRINKAVAKTYEWMPKETVKND